MASEKTRALYDYIKTAGLSLLAPDDGPIDWRYAAAIAFQVAEVDKARINGPWRPLSRDFDRLVKKVEPHIAEFTKLQPAQPLGYPVVFDRAEWIVTAIDTIRPLVEPVFGRMASVIADRGKGLKASARLTQGAATVQIGTILGYLAKRVLGQYDLPMAGGDITPGGNLYFIYPNIANLQKNFNLNRDEFHLWLALHEATHSYEFESHPWLHSYLLGLIDENTEFMEAKLRDIFNKSGTASGVFDITRSIFSHPLKDLISIEANETLGRIQAFMSVVEGYSDYVMHELSQKIIPHSEEIAHLFARTERSKNFAERLLEKFIGLDIKLRQYRLGREFIAVVADHGGLELANQVWTGPESMPSLREINQPLLWIKRMG